MLEIQKIKEYSKAYKTLTEHYKNLLERMNDELPSDQEISLPEINDEYMSLYITQLLILNPRALYEFFDKNGVRVAVTPNMDDSNYTYWNDINKLSFIASSRVEAEERAFMDAFKTLEEK